MEDSSIMLGCSAGGEILDQASEKCENFLQDFLKFLNSNAIGASISYLPRRNLPKITRMLR